MQKVVCFEPLFLFQLYSPLDTSPCFFEKKKDKETVKQNKNLKTPYPCEVCSCVLNFMAIGH